MEKYFYLIFLNMKSLNYEMTRSFRCSTSLILAPAEAWWALWAHVRTFGPQQPVKEWKVVSLSTQFSLLAIQMNYKWRFENSKMLATVQNGIMKWLEVLVAMHPPFSCCGAQVGTWGPSGNHWPLVAYKRLKSY